MRPAATASGNGGDRRRCSTCAPVLQGCVLPLMTGLSALWGGGTESTLPRFPLEAEGDIRFTADAVVFLDASDKPEAIVYLAVPEPDMEFVSIADQPGDWMQLDATLTFLNAGRDALVSMTSHLDVPRGTEPGPERSSDPVVDPGVGPAREPVTDPDPARRIVRFTAPLREDVRGFEIEIQDPNASRRGLIPLVQSKHKRGVARGTVTLPDLSSGWAVSAPLFLWDHATADMTTSQDRWEMGDALPMREQLDPHPAHTYGLENTALDIYLELYGLEQCDTELTTRVISLADSTTLYENTSRVTPRWHRCGALRQMDVSRLPAGTYAVEFKARPVVSPAQTARPGLSAATSLSATLVTGHFQVLWDARAWRAPHRDLVEEASLLFEGDAWEHFLSLQPGQQEATLDSLWEALAGEGAIAAMNDAKICFRERLAVADARYGGPQRGCTTDRGRVYVHFGEPDEIHKELAPREEDLIYKFIQREVSDIQASGTGGRPRVHWLDSSAYQVWYYNNRGHPLLPSQALRVRDGALRFIFLDELGSGNYRLIYSNLFGGMI
jgi:GWxTD domain-containing protein